MQNEVNEQLAAIRAMMSTGHRCIRMERHSLLLWGITGGFLCIATDYIIRPERFSTTAQYMTAWLVFEIIVLSGVALLDLSYTRYRKHERGESFPFIHAQITKAWCLFIIMGVLFTFGCGFFGGGYMIFGVWLFLIGLGLFVHGLFSEQMLEWAGVIIILLGIVPLGLKAPYEFTKLLAASVFAIGHPALCLFLDDQKDTGLFKRLGRFTVWLLMILTPPLIAWNYLKIRYEPAVSYSQSVPLQTFMGLKSTAAPQVVALPAGVSVPVRIKVYGNMFRNGEAIMPLTLSRPVEIALENGKPTGYFRVAGEKWKYYKYNISIWGKESLDCELTPADGPTATAGLQINMEN